jgi:hypothetical protein
VCRSRSKRKSAPPPVIGERSSQRAGCGISRLRLTRSRTRTSRKLRTGCGRCSSRVCVTSASRSRNQTTTKPLLDASCDGESACKRDSVVVSDRWPSICAAYPRGVRVATDGRAARSLCLTLLRVEFAEPCESPLTLVRSYRTVSPSPVPGCPGHRRSLSVALVRQVTPTWLSPAPCPVESRLSSTRSCRAAATRPTHHRSGECTSL